ncbi:hypothetical protein QO179_24850 [Bacillus stercoris]|nr:hypothetical protein [Bacillus stercoris]
MASWRLPGGAGNAAGQQSLRSGSKFLTKGTLGFGALDTAMNMAGGDDFGTALGKGAASAALWYTAPGMMWAYTAATTVPQAVGAGYQWYRQQKDWWNSAHLQGTVGGNYQDTQRALTMRQAAVEAIQGSKLNARSALGGEARILNQNWSRS